MFGIAYYFNIVFIALPVLLFGIFWYVFTIKGKGRHTEQAPQHVTSETDILEDASLLNQDELLIKVKEAFEKEELLLAEEYLFHLVKRATDEALVRESLERLIEVTMRNEKFTLALEHGTRYRMAYGEQPAIELLLTKAYIELNDTDRAREIYDKILAQDAKNIDALSGLAMLYRKQGNHDRAREIQQEIFVLQQNARD